MSRWRALPDDLDPQIREFAETLRRLVDRSGLGVAAVADRTGYGRTSWERYLDGQLLPPRGAVRALAEVTGSDLAHLSTMWELAERAWSRAELRDDATREAIRVARAHTTREHSDPRTAHGGWPRAEPPPAGSTDAAAGTGEPSEVGRSVGDEEITVRQPLQDAVSTVPQLRVGRPKGGPGPADPDERATADEPAGRAEPGSTTPTTPSDQVDQSAQGVSDSSDAPDSSGAANTANGSDANGSDAPDAEPATVPSLLLPTGPPADDVPADGEPAAATEGTTDPPASFGPPAKDEPGEAPTLPGTVSLRPPSTSGPGEPRPDVPEPDSAEEPIPTVLLSGKPPTDEPSRDRAEAAPASAASPFADPPSADSLPADSEGAGAAAGSGAAGDSGASGDAASGEGASDAEDDPTTPGAGTPAAASPFDLLAPFERSRPPGVSTAKDAAPHAPDATVVLPPRPSAPPPAPPSAPTQAERSEPTDHSRPTDREDRDDRRSADVPTPADAPTTPGDAPTPADALTPADARTPTDAPTAEDGTESWPGSRPGSPPEGRPETDRWRLDEPPTVPQGARSEPLPPPLPVPLSVTDAVPELPDARPEASASQPSATGAESPESGSGSGSGSGAGAGLGGGGGGVAGAGTPGRPGDRPTPPGGRRRTRLLVVGGIAALLVLALAVLLVVLPGGEDDAEADGPPSGSPTPTASSAPPSDLPAGVECVGESCAGQDPERAGCGDQAVTAAEATLGQVHLEVRYSEVCGASWARVTSASPGDTVEVRAGDGSETGRAGEAGAGYTAMVVPGAEGARACVTLQTGEQGCTAPAVPGA